MMSFLRILLAFAIAMALLPDWPADAASLVSATATPPREAAGYTSWLVGLFCGVILTIAARVSWRDLPRRATAWVRAQSTRAGWAALGLCYAWILAFY